MKQLALLLAVLLSPNLFAQPLLKYYNLGQQDIGETVIQGPDGNYIIGLGYGTGNFQDPSFIKVNQNGDFLYSGHLSTTLPFNKKISDLQPIGTNRIAAMVGPAGGYPDSLKTDIIIMDQNGNQLFNYLIPEFILGSSQVCVPFNNRLLTAYLHKDSNGVYLNFLELDQNGVVYHKKTIPTYLNRVIDLKVASNGDVYLLSGWNTDRTRLSRFNSNLDLQENFEFFDEFIFAEEIELLGSEFLLAARGIGTGALSVRRMNMQGNVSWIYNRSGDYQLPGVNVLERNAGQVLVTGYVQDSIEELIYTVLDEGTGILIDEYMYGPSATNCGISMTKNNTGEILIVGMTDQRELYNADVLFVKSNQFNQLSQVLEQLKIELSIYPVPAADYINIEFSSGNSKAHSLLVYDMQGKLVLEEGVLPNQENRLDIDLETGTYTYQILDSSSKIASGIFSVQF